MGIPTNQTKGQGCNPVSSNCVIWQGPDIPCLDLCHGDSVTDVVAKLATEVCDILDTLDIKTYDITCFQPICPTPENFHDLIQFLITKVCELQCCCDGTKPVESPCPDACIVTVAPCFYFVNQIGDTITTMTLAEYVTAIGNKLCALLGQTAETAARQTNTEITVAEQGQRLTTVEEELSQAIITLPASCLYPAETPADAGITAIATELCNLEQATGTPIELLQAIQKQCANIDNSRQLANRFSNMGSIPGWVNAISYNSVADSLNNMWLAICDIRAAVENIMATCCCTDCDDVNISFTATLTGDPPSVLNLFFTGSIPTGLADCSPSGNLITITDANGGSYTTYVQVVNSLNGPAVQINLGGTPVNASTNLTITIQGCWNRPAPGTDCGGLRCERILTYSIINTAPCPSPFNVVAEPTSIDYDFINNVAGPVTYTVELYTSPGGVFVTSDTYVNPAQFAVVSGDFTGLLCATNYYILVKVTIAGNTTTCPQAFVTTQPCPCAAPTAVSATNIIP